MPKYLTKKMFEQAMHSTFRIRLEGSESIEVEQIELNEGPSAPHQEQFAVVFHGPAHQRLGQGLYKFDHDAMGEFGLFIVPVGKDRDGFLYEAVFNRQIKE